jgi:two-component system response regulator AtoC
MAATHRNLEAAIENETFREDLYYRLNVITIKLPPLRERKEDILALAQTFLQKHAGDTAAPPISPGMHQAMLNYEWPGNIRELENMMRRFIILRDQVEFASELSFRCSRQRPVSMTPAPALAMPVALSAPVHLEPQSVLLDVAKAKDVAEADAIIKALDATHWNRKRAAQLLNIDYKALLYKMKKLSIGEENSAASAGDNGKDGMTAVLVHTGNQNA